MRRVSMADVAARAGVSGQTVSRVANDSPRVDADTRARVLAAMRELGYRPHRAARALRTGRSHTIGVIAATLSSVGNSLVLQAISEAAARADYSISLVALGGDISSADAIARLQDQGVDGIIVLNEASGQLGEAVIPASLAVVAIDAAADARLAIIRTDHYAGARLAVEHLRARGRRRIAHIGGPEGSFAASERLRAWAELVEDDDREGLLARGDWTSASGYEAARRLLREVTPDAVFAANDQMALGLLRALAEEGFSVPRDVAVVGFDDIETAAFSSPPLTTVRQDFSALGEEAVREILRRLDGVVEAGSENVISGTIVVRSSS